MKKGLTLSLIFEAQSANYGEGFGNITALKRISRQGGDGYTYISRQALRYNMIEQLGWDNTPVEAMGSGEKKVIQYKPETSIADYPEIDLFGYMKTDKGSGANTRSAVVRLSNAVSLEPYNSDLDFLTNTSMAKRIDASNSIAQSEIHKSFYAYTITIDLDRVGIDKDVQCDNGEKVKRVTALLKTIQFLYRDIKGRRENLAPVFAVGGVYERKSPFFENRFRLNKQELCIAPISETIESIGENTLVGYINGIFKNDEEIKKALKPVVISNLFDQLCREVEAVYQ
ncbi:crispr-associated negative auto-regulator devr/csa2 [Lucifera butyrica]|uniref:Crispr-associated negative auto-regulator devr/csa2 n=1 Tax=Lucifera butyrica TaxID=1351585 RepID=A0A498RAD7_9FIRM|nr:type I-B CRISPR-associated protein Cas7/Cst2/DevR [Lucifera butyrica]VBB06128.1 crispr-associated negative auto-regulator devr/csa2 [Lucifera butyrica]